MNKYVVLLLFSHAYMIKEIGRIFINAELKMAKKKTALHEKNTKQKNSTHRKYLPFSQ